MKLIGKNKRLMTAICKGILNDLYLKVEKL